MNVAVKVALSASCMAGIACGQGARTPAREANAAIDSLTVRLVDAYRKHDARAYASLYTDTAAFEWPGFNTLRGSAALTAMARENWAPMRDMDLAVTVAARRFAADHATEYGTFQHSWTDSSGTRMTEFGRYVWMLVPEKNGSWRIDRFFGFEDSTRAALPGPPLAAQR